MIEQNIYDDLRELFVLLVYRMQEVLRPYQLTVEQHDTLQKLDLETGWRMGDLTRKTLSDNSKMTRTVDYLETNGWVERRPDPVDRRAQRVYLTESGAALRDEVKAEHDTALQNWLTQFSEEQKSQLQTLLTQFRDQMRTISS
jgi:DNA-binding MarR family transcriptional regulator